MTPTDVQLMRDAFELIVSDAPQAPLLDASVRLEPSSLAGRGGRGGWLVAAAAALAVLVTVGVLPILVGNGGESAAPTRRSPRATATPSTTVTALTRPLFTLGDPIKLGELGSPDPELKDMPMGLAVGPNGTVVTGYLSRGLEAGPAIWHSTDGNGFQLVYSEPIAGDDSPETAFIIDVAASGNGFLAFGRRTIDGVSQQVVWLSEDGTDWTTHPIGGIDGDVMTVVGHDQRWLAAGTRPSGAGLWRSSDGVNWMAVESPGFSVDGSRAIIFDIAASGDQVAAVGGSNGLDQRRERPQIWISNDRGATWKRVSTDPQLFDIPVGDGLQSVAIGPNGILALGQERAREGEETIGTIMYHSADGSTWQSMSSDHDGFDVVATDSGFVSFDQYHDPALTGTATISSDGLVWTQVDGFRLESFGVSAAVSTDGTIIVVGLDGLESTSNRSDAGAVYQIPVTYLP